MRTGSMVDTVLAAPASAPFQTADLRHQPIMARQDNLAAVETELAFEKPVTYQSALIFRTNTGHTVAIFRQINKGALHVNHDALEFPDGKTVLLTRLSERQNATVLTLPTQQPQTAANAKDQQRVTYVG
jgi:hypothetical protein